MCNGDAKTKLGQNQQSLCDKKCPKNYSPACAQAFEDHFFVCLYMCIIYLIQVNNSFDFEFTAVRHVSTIHNRRSY